MTDQLTRISTYEWPGRTVFGPGAAAQIGIQAASLGVSHLFVLHDPGVTALLSSITGALTVAGLTFTLFDGVIGNPDVRHTDAAAAAYRKSGADCVVGLGGGSALDMAKAVRMLAGGPASVSSAEYLSTLGEKVRPAPHVLDMPPMIAIPTTAGTGSEVTPWGVITDHTTHQKSGVGGVNLLPTVALIDPVLTLDLPPFLTAATGMDALSHLVEAYVSTNRNPILDPLILRGIRLVGRSLETAVHKPHNVHARSDLMEAAMLGGIAISSNWLGACHSLAHQLSTFADVHHGLACAIMLPHQMAFSLPAAPERYRDIARALDPDNDTPTAEVAPELVASLLAAIGLATSLSAAGVSKDSLPVMTEYAMKDLNWTTNPRPTTLEDMAAMYRAAY